MIVRFLMHPLRHDQVIARDRQFRRITQTEAASPAQIAALRICARAPWLSGLAQLLNLSRNLFQPPLPLLRQARHLARRLLVVSITLLLPAPNPLPDARPFAPQLLQTVAAIGRGAGLHSRRVDRHSS